MMSKSEKFEVRPKFKESAINELAGTEIARDLRASGELKLALRQSTQLL